MILGQLSDYNNMLKAQADARKDMQSVKRKTISEENVIKPRLISKANENSPNRRKARFLRE